MIESFPFLNKKIYNIPESFKLTGLLCYNLDFVFKYFDNAKNNQFKQGYASPNISELSFRKFQDLVYRFSIEIAEYTNKQDYRDEFVKGWINSIKESIDKIFNLIEPNKDEFFAIKMHDSMFPGYKFKNNWYELIYDELLFIQKIINSKKFDSLTITQEQNPHPRYFKNRTAFELFEHLKDTVRDPLADYSFIFHTMKKDEYIFKDITGIAFINWLNKIYNIELTQTKLTSINKCTTKPKKDIYIESKQLYKP